MKSISYIDGANLYAAHKNLQRDFDFNKFATAAATLLPRVRPIRQMYFALLRPDQDIDPVRPLLDYLAYNGFQVVEKYMREYTDGQNQSRYRGNVIPDMAVSMVEMSSVVDHITLFSGDGDLLSAVQAVQRKAVQVTVVSPLSMTSDELRRQADQFVDIKDLDVFKPSVPVVGKVK